MASRPKTVVRYVPPPRYPFPGIRAFFWRLNFVRRIRLRSYDQARRGSNLWLAVAATFWIVRYLRRTLPRHPELAATEKLLPGQSILLTAIAPPTRAERRAARKGGSS